MQIRMTGYKFNVDKEGNTENVLVNYQSFDGNNQLTTQVELTPDKHDLDDMSRSGFDKAGRETMLVWLTGE